MKKDYENYAVYGLLTLVTLTLVFSVYSNLKTGSLEEGGNSLERNNPSLERNNQDTNSKKPFESIDSGSTDSGDVSIELMPYEIKNGLLKIKISVNTHSVNLNQFDLKQITSLEYEGKTAKPISAPSLGSHHNNGELIFDIENEKELDLFTIKIGGIPMVMDRIFTWKN